MVRAMSRATFCALALLVGCAEPDMRPLRVQYATETILQPSCGPAQCHSTFRQADGWAFDTVDQVRKFAPDLITLEPRDRSTEPSFFGVPEASLLYLVLIRDEERMPYDQPLPQNDIDYIREWIESGAEGAQCNPENTHGCVGRQRYVCGEDGNLGALAESCMRGCNSLTGACVE